MRLDGKTTTELTDSSGFEFVAAMTLEVRQHRVSTAKLSRVVADRQVVRLPLFFPL